VNSTRQGSPRPQQPYHHRLPQQQRNPAKVKDVFDEDASYPRAATVAGEIIELRSVSLASDRRELITTGQRNGCGTTSRPRFTVPTLVTPANDVGATSPHRHGFTPI